MDYIIEDVKCGITEGGMACGPVPGNVVVSLKFNDGNTSKWLNNVEVDGIPSFYLTNEDVFDSLMAEDFEDDDYVDLLDETYINSFNKVELEEYDDIFASFKNADRNDVNLIKAIIWVTRCSMSELNSVMSYLKGKKASEIEVPELDVEY